MLIVLTSCSSFDNFSVLDAWSFISFCPFTCFEFTRARLLFQNAHAFSATLLLCSIHIALMSVSNPQQQFKRKFHSLFSTRRSIVQYSCSFLSFPYGIKSSCIRQFCRFGSVVKSRYINDENVSSCLRVQDMRKKRNQRSRKRKGKRERMYSMTRSHIDTSNGSGIIYC